MSETQTTKRLKQVAVEFNVGIATVVDFLSSKGIEIESKPTTKVPEEAYLALLEKFQPDKLTKEKSDKLKLTPLIHKEEKEKAAEQKKEAEATKPKEEPKVEKPAEPAPEVKEEAAPTPAPEEPKEEKEAPATEEIRAEKEPEKEEEEAGGLKVVGKIDLDSFKKKGKKDTKAAAEEEEKKKEEEKPAPVAEEEKKTAAEAAPVEEENLEDVRMDDEEVKELVERTVELLKEDTKEEKKEEKAPAGKKKEKEEEKKGLTIVGKIDLQQFEKPKKKPLASTDDLSTIKKKRRKRKRIGEGPEQQGGGRPQQGGPGQGRGPAGGGRGRGPAAPPRTEKDKEQDEKRIQEEIKKTLNRLTQKGSGESKSRLKKRKKEERRQQRQAEEAEAEATSKTIQVTEFITANELATLMDVQVNQVIMACMSLGLMVSINQRLDAETITVVADEFGYEVVFKDAEMDEPLLEEEDDEDEMADRAPIVTIMGHVDHGKTSLLDFIRRSNVIAGEAGGITQHIGAYEVTLESGKKIAFLDTPGHEAFTAMRARGAKVTDIAIIVVAADDSVMPQTKEAISHAQAAGVPIVFAFNKIDKDGANADRIREQLAEMNILVEEWGGKYQTQEISAKKGLNIDELLDKVLLEAEMLELKADPTKRAIGTVIEASLDKGKGNVATVLVEKGTLRIGDPILAGPNYGRVKALFNERGGKVEEAGPATPVQVLGFDGAPSSGDKFYVTESEQLAKEVATKRKQLVREQGIRTRKHITLDEIGRRLAIGNFKELNLIIKGDVDGSVEALSDSLQKLSTEEVQVNVIFKGVGQISESDVLLAQASDAIIIGFQVRPSVSARKMAENEQIDIRMYSVIYDAIEEVKAAMEGLLAPTHEEKIVSNIEIRETFKITKVGTIAGCYVLDGKITRNTKIRVIRDGVVVYTGELASLKRFKDDVKEVSAGYECGLNVQNFNDIKVGDIIEGYEEIQVARKL